MSTRSERYNVGILFEDVACRISEIAALVPGFTRDEKYELISVVLRSYDSNQQERRQNCVLMRGKVRYLLDSATVRDIKQIPPIVDIYHTPRKRRSKVVLSR
ncbi:MAG: hypothetical protein HY344_04260 [Candidatus Levybacteria bacterium]|nr:hypothetical protein [Candidatus Levybacteria bacterium]